MINIDGRCRMNDRLAVILILDALMSQAIPRLSESVTLQAGAIVGLGIGLLLGCAEIACGWRRQHRLSRMSTRLNEAGSVLRWVR